MPSDPKPTSWIAPESAGAFGGFIGPRNLIALVTSTAPWLFDGSIAAFKTPPPTTGTRLSDHADHPLGWWSILRHADLLPTKEVPTAEDWTDYFALCVACHFATVATYVPTDVDTKIRNHLWFLRRPPAERDRVAALVASIARWDVGRVSARIVDVPGEGPVSGHDGERLSILCGGLVGLRALGDHEGADALERAVDDELAREARAFDKVAAMPGRERPLLMLAASLTHNAGDVDQGLSAGGGDRASPKVKDAFARLAHERPDRYGGSFGRAARLYRELLAAEGHRHYPLREIRILRSDPGLLLPVGPFLDAWGARLATWPKFSPDQRAEVLTGIVDGCRKVKGQLGYYRALAGFAEAHPGGLEADALQRALTAGTRKELRDPEMRKLIAVRRESFEGSLAKRARAILCREGDAS